MKPSKSTPANQLYLIERPCGGRHRRPTICGTRRLFTRAGPVESLKKPSGSSQKGRWGAPRGAQKRTGRGRVRRSGVNDGNGRGKKTFPVSFWPLEEAPGAPRGRPRRPEKAPRRRPDVRGGPREAVRTAAESIRRVDDGRKSPQRCTGAPREAPGEAREGQNRQNPMCFTMFFACWDFLVYVTRREVERHPERPKVALRTVKISPGGPQEAPQTGPVGSWRGL